MLPITSKSPGFKPRTMDRILAPQKCHKCGITTLAPVLVNDTSNCGFKPRTMDRILAPQPLCQGFRPEPTEELCGPPGLPWTLHNVLKKLLLSMDCNIPLVGSVVK